MVKTLLKFARDEVLLPLVKRPRRLQVAALCLRNGDGGREVLLITSRGTGRWILPKGWPEKGTDAAGTALREAWEEAGVKRATTHPSPVGQYTSEKHNDGGLVLPCDVLVFRVDVHEMTRDYPERGQRKLVWVAPGDAADMVAEHGLKTILRAQKPA
ncbi:NUDIX hydrolase [Acuticoccus sediminis]|uniref:NUDIX hydrolase n=1 Tax=Acuticoccus sediminis TaxID=2184697 RepID=A0A8B2NZU3_9HYPH|nr:NUDIX hydrolase [Acuticoccus sediminis]RAI03224.1 NUDIX hydrolase [Acuticoccus sediminis]